MLPQDYHLHTHFSGDSRAEMEAVCRAAIARGIREIAFVDHHDFETFSDEFNRLRLCDYRAEIERCRGLYGDRLTIRCGVEVGEPHAFPAQARELLGGLDFDVVMASLHYIGETATWNGQFFSRYPLEEGVRAYFAELARMVAEADFDILGHFDVVLYAAHHTFGLGTLDYTPYEDEVRAILRTLAARGRALEINTKSLRRGMRASNPPLQVLRWFREEGGERVTVGSDAHEPDSVGAGLELALILAREAGFTQLACYEGRQVRPVPL
mgnify:CR=1 FL=1